MIKKFNNWIALQITKGVATMWCAYAFLGLAIIGAPYGSTNPRDWVQWLSQTLIQLTMLSIIMVGQKIIGEMHEEKNKTIHDDLRKVHEIHMREFKKIHGATKKISKL